MTNSLYYGSSGDEVRKLQQSLVDKGYSVGSNGVDGDYGPETQAAVLRYQRDNGLDVDGIAGVQTQGHLYGNATSQSGATKPYYTEASDQQLNDLYQQIVNRDKFSYDINEDELFQQYANEYARRGEMAMMDTMGQAAALTGGYGSTYAQVAGQQQYDAYLQQLTAQIPEFYDRAYNRYQQEGNDLLDQYNFVMNRLDYLNAQSAAASGGYGGGSGGSSGSGGSNGGNNENDEYSGISEARQNKIATDAKNFMASMPNLLPSAYGFSFENELKYAIEKNDYNEEEAKLFRDFISNI